MAYLFRFLFFAVFLNEGQFICHWISFCVYFGCYGLVVSSVVAKGLRFEDKDLWSEDKELKSEL